MILTEKHIQELERKAHFSATVSLQEQLEAVTTLSEYYTFTNISKAQELLFLQSELLKKENNIDFTIYYYLNNANVENQLYNYLLSEQHFATAVDLAEQYAPIQLLNEVYLDYCGTLVNLGKREKVGEYLERVQRNLQQYPDAVLAARLKFREGFYSLNYNDYERTIEMLLEAEKMYDQIGEKNISIKDWYFITLIHSGLGNVFSHTGDKIRSADAYKKGMLKSEELGMKSRLGWHYLNVGNAYLALDDIDLAADFFQKVLVFEPDLSQQSRASATANLGFCYLTKGSYKRAGTYLEKAEKIYLHEPQRNIDNLARIYKWKAELYDATGQSKLSEEFYQKALEYSQKAQKPQLKAQICKELANYFAERKEYKKAYEYMSQHAEYAEIHAEEVNKSKASEWKIKYDADKKRQEAEMLRLQATSLQLKALRAQMNPHFFSNALNAIQQYITSEDSVHAAQYLAKFAKLMRASLDYSELEIISLEDEIAFLRDYLEINQKLRFANRLHFDITIDEDIEEDIMGVPTMIIQPYIENAIEHGIKINQGGLIRLDFKLLDENTICCTIEDNGIGRAKAQELQQKSGYHERHKSRGTNITEQRLEILHQYNTERMNQIFIQIIDLYTPQNKGCGTRVEISIPIVEIPLAK